METLFSDLPSPSTFLMKPDGMTIDTAAAATPPAMPAFTEAEEARLRDSLKRCSTGTIEAACAYRRTGSADLIPTIIGGLIERYTARDARAKLLEGNDSLRLTEDLALDSLTLLEIVFLAEEVLQITVDNEELRPFETVGDVKAFIASKLREAGS
jgi:3-hydroxyacyl-[acyl-carrier-protein] dehydratase